MTSDETNHPEGDIHSQGGAVNFGSITNTGGMFAGRDLFNLTFKSDLSAAEIEQTRQNILDQWIGLMAKLIIERNLRPGGDRATFTALRYLTASAMRYLDSTRNSEILRFLREAELFGDDGIYFGAGNLSGAQLEKADFRELNLNMVKFERANLKHAWLWGSQLEGADFGEANLESAQLYDAFAPAVRFNKADLRAADLSQAMLSMSRFRTANLEGAILGGCDLTSCDFRDAILEGSILSGANLEDATLSDDFSKSAVIFDENTTWPDGSKG